MPLKQTPHLYRENKQYQRGKQRKVFPVLLAIKRMLRNDDRWDSFERQLESLVDEYSDVLNLSFMGFPADWKTVLSRP